MKKDQKKRKWTVEQKLESVYGHGSQQIRLLQMEESTGYAESV